MRPAISTRRSARHLCSLYCTVAVLYSCCTVAVLYGFPTHLLANISISISIRVLPLVTANPTVLYKSDTSDPCPRLSTSKGDREDSRYGRSQCPPEKGALLDLCYADARAQYRHCLYPLPSTLYLHRDLAKTKCTSITVNVYLRTMPVLGHESFGCSGLPCSTMGRFHLVARARGRVTRQTRQRQCTHGSTT